jgi:hypothetical protein
LFTCFVIGPTLPAELFRMTLPVWDCLARLRSLA